MKYSKLRNHSIMSQIEKMIFQSSNRKFVVFVLVSIVARSGVWYVPHFSAITQMANNPFVNPFPDANGQYNFFNWLGPFLAWVLHFRTFHSYFFFNLLITVAFALLAINWMIRMMPGRGGRLVALVFSALPVSTLAFYWVGYDGLTLLIVVAILALWKRAILVFFLGILAGMQHFEQTFMAFGCVAIASILFKKYKVFEIRPAFSALLGIVVGKLLLSLIFSLNNIELNSGRVYYLKAHLRVILTEFMYHPQIFLYTALGMAWIPLLYIFKVASNSKIYWMPLALILLIAPISGDGTRVLAIVTFPIAIFIVIKNISILESLSNKTVAFMFLILLITPFSFAWGGHPRWSALPFDIVWLLNLVFGWPQIPEDLSFWVINS